MPKVTKDTKKSNLKDNISNKKKIDTLLDISKTNKKESQKKVSTINKTQSNIIKNKKTNTSISAKKKTSKPKKVEQNLVVEYYDLPYRYNETIVKVLYQSPNVLFVYWDISDDDRNEFIHKYGDDFFNNTKPVLKIFNLTKDYNFEIEINDFANSWYLTVDDANCNYRVELARREINKANNINSNYVYVSSSNNIESPNNHILLENLPSTINFKNIKTNNIISKDMKKLNLFGLKKQYNTYDFYEKLYKDEMLNNLTTNKSINSPSSWS